MRKRWTGLYQSELQICDTGNTRVGSSVWGRPTPHDHLRLKTDTSVTLFYSTASQRVWNLLRPLDTDTPQTGVQEAEIRLVNQL